MRDSGPEAAWIKGSMILWQHGPEAVGPVAWIRGSRNNGQLPMAWIRGSMIQGQLGSWFILKSFIIEAIKSMLILKCSELQDSNTLGNRTGLQQIHGYVQQSCFRFLSYVMTVPRPLWAATDAFKKSRQCHRAAAGPRLGIHKPHE
eukprot:scaffold104134_cov15-Tisochrysis_lutea.AAC.1